MNLMWILFTVFIVSCNVTTHDLSFSSNTSSNIFLVEYESLENAEIPKSLKDEILLFYLIRPDEQVVLSVNGKEVTKGLNEGVFSYSISKKKLKTIGIQVRYGKFDNEVHFIPDYRYNFLLIDCDLTAEIGIDPMWWLKYKKSLPYFQ